MILAAAIPSSPRSVRWRWRDHSRVPRGRDGRSLSSTAIGHLLAPGETLGPADRRILRVLVSDEGMLFTFAELAELARICVQHNDEIEKANRLHRHIHPIRRALAEGCWIDVVPGFGVTFMRRKQFQKAG